MVRFELKKNSDKNIRIVRNILLDLIWLFALSLIPLGMYGWDRAFMELYRSCAVVTTAATMLLAVFTELIEGPRKTALSAATLFEIGMILQLRLLWPGHNEMADSMNLVLIALFAMSVGVLLGPWLARLIRCLSVRRPVLLLNLGVAAAYLLLMLFGYGVNGGKVWLQLFGMGIPVTTLLACPVLVTLGLIFTDKDRTDRKKCLDAVLTLAMNAVFLAYINDFSVLVGLALVGILLGVLYFSDFRYAGKLALMLVLPVIFVCLACFGCLMLVENGEFTGFFGELLAAGAKVSRRISMLVEPLLKLDSTNIQSYGYQAYKANMVIFIANLLGAAPAVTPVPNEATDYVFCALINHMGILMGLAVLVLAAVMTRSAVNACLRTADRGVGGVGVAFALYLGAQSLLSASVSVGLVFSMGIPFAFLSRGGWALALNCLMIACILWTSRGTGSGGGETTRRAAMIHTGMYIWIALILLRILLIRL